MPIFTRSSKATCLISHQNIRATISAIKSRPGQTVRDYRIIMANDSVFASVNTINLVLECTPEGRDVVRKGMVTRLPTRGPSPTWTKLKGAIVKQPSLAYRPAVYNRATLDMGSDVEAEIVSDANSTLQIAADAIMRTATSAKTAAHVIDVLRDIVHASASREDMRAKANIDYEARIDGLTKTLASQNKLIDLMEQVHESDQRLQALTFRPHTGSVSGLAEA